MLFILLFFADAAAQSSTMQTIYQLAYWESYETACTITLDEDRTPTNQEILDSCGESLYMTWMTTPICNRNYANQNEISACTGLFLRRVGQREREENQQNAGHLPQDIRQIRFEVQNVNCDPGYACPEKPELLLKAIAPDGLQDIISSVHIRIDSYEASCNGATCQMRMPLTPDRGSWFEYWAMTGSGEQSDHYWLKFRILEQYNGYGQQYDYQIVGNAFPDQGAYGSDVWYAFPSLNQPLPGILQKVHSADYLVTKHPYSMLSSKLIQSGQCDASGCIHFGLNADGSANGCGEDVTAQMVFNYQNQYDDQLFAAGNRYKVPPRVVKGLIAQESQFWPHSDTPYEYGLGKMTEAGADMLLRWNSSYFLNLCLEVYPSNKEKCYAGFSSLSEEDQIVLRGSVLAKVGTGEEIDMLTATVRASMLQINQLVNNVTGNLPSDITSYEDLWKFTIANYYSGSGCLYNAMSQVFSLEQALTWDNVKNFMYGQCSMAAQYLDRVYELGN